MTDILIRPEINEVPRKSYYADGPIDFETWLQLSQDYDTELIDGVMVDRVAANVPHEFIFGWLHALLRVYVNKRGLGVVLGSRTAVKISSHSGRLPDILFVRAENREIIKKDAIYGAPDLVIEIVSPNDRPSDLVPLEANYRALGVNEIVFIDPQLRRLRLVQWTGEDYRETYLTEGRLTLRTVPGFRPEIDWIFADERPNEMDAAQQLLEEAASEP